MSDPIPRSITFSLVMRASSRSTFQQRTRNSSCVDAHRVGAMYQTLCLAFAAPPSLTTVHSNNLTGNITTFHLHSLVTNADHSHTVCTYAHSSHSHPNSYYCTPQRPLAPPTTHLKHPYSGCNDHRLLAGAMEAWVDIVLGIHYRRRADSRSTKVYEQQRSCPPSTTTSTPPVDSRRQCIHTAGRTHHC